MDELRIIEQITSSMGEQIDRVQFGKWNTIYVCTNHLIIHNLKHDFITIKKICI